MRPDVDWAALVSRAVALARTPGCAILGITGKPGAGKTTLARALVLAATTLGSENRPAYVPMDGFHLADVQLDRLGLRDRKGAPQTFDAAGYAAILARIRTGTDDVVYAPEFERDLEQPIAATIAVARDVRLVVTEGNYLLHADSVWQAVRALVDEVWYCELDDAIRIERLTARHVEFGKSPEEARAWVRRSDEANAAVIEQTRAHADLVVRLDGLLLPYHG